MTATRKKAAGRKRPVAKRQGKRPIAPPIPSLAICAVGEGFSIENRRTGRRVSWHKTYNAAWARRLKILRAERAAKSVSPQVYTAEDHD